MIQEDEAIAQLALHLQQNLNLRQSGTVAAIRAYDDIPNDPTAYPCLVIHRVSSKGDRLHQCTGKIKYILINQTERQHRPGLFRWVELAIADILSKYDYVNPLIKIDTGSLLGSYRIGSFANAVFPFLEISFEFLDEYDLPD